MNCSKCGVGLLPVEEKSCLCSSCAGEPAAYQLTLARRAELLQQFKHEKYLAEVLSIRALDTVPFRYCSRCPRDTRGKVESISGELVPFYTSPKFGMSLCVVHLVIAAQERIEEALIETKKTEAN